MPKLNLGSGPHPLDGYVNIDLYRPADVQDNAITLKQFQLGSVEAIKADHILEHLGKRDGQRAIIRWHQLLAPGGTIKITVPDVVMSIRAWLHAYESGSDVWGFRSHAIWGDQAHAGEYHCWGFDEASLYDYMSKVGFRDIEISREDGHDPEYPGGKRPGWWIVARAVK